MIKGSLQNFKIFAFTHKTLPLELVGRFHIAPDKIFEKLSALRDLLQIGELMYLSTCNRVEFMLVEGNQRVDAGKLIPTLNTDLSVEEELQAFEHCEVFSADEAVKHLFKVSASLDSMVIGEREIITQVRKSYEDCHAHGLTGELLRLIVRKTIETAKKVFTETDIFKKPVSVVSLGFHRLREMNVPADSRILMIGAGKTNRAMIRFLVKHGFKNITIYNRSILKAQDLAKEIGGKSASLQELKNHSSGFDILISCTAASEPIVSPEIFVALLNGETQKKIVMDLAIPSDIDPIILKQHGNSIAYINIAQLKVIADRNLSERSLEIEKCENIIDAKLLEFHDLCKEREIELAMQDIPRKVKEIKHMAVDKIYAKELAGMNAESREVLDKVIAYMEKKYISVPMKMAKEVMRKA